MPDYAKMKNSELEALLKQRSLPSGGKKADMVARLVEADGKAGGDPAKAEPEPTAKEAPPAKAAAAPSTATSSAAKPVAPTADPAAPILGAGDDAAEKKDVEGATADGAEKQAEAETKPAVDFTTGMAATSIDEEIARRKKRAAKFGTATDETETQAIKNLERQKRFAVEGDKGAAEAPRGVHGLDQALPERTNRKRGRVEEEATDKETLTLEDSALKRRRGGGAHRGRGRGRGQGRGGGSGGGRQAAPGSWMTEADKKAAAARKERFAPKPALT